MSEREEKLIRIIDRLLRGYLICAQDKYIVNGRLDPFNGDTDGAILTNIAGTKEGIEIKHYLKKLKEMGVEL